MTKEILNRADLGVAPLGIQPPRSGDFVKQCRNSVPRCHDGFVTAAPLAMS